MDEDSRFEGLERFDRVDATDEQAMFLAFLEKVESFPDVMARRRLSYRLLGLRPGDRCADIGCGLGTAACELAEAVGSGGKATGLDLSEAMVTAARRRAAARGASADFLVADASTLPFADGAIDGYRAERVYQHLADPEGCLAEARRSLASGGRIVLIDQDWDTLIFASDHPTIGREICAAFCDSLVNGQAGRRFDALLRDAGFGEVSVTPDAFATPDASSYGFVADLSLKAARAAGMAEDRVAIWEADQRRRMADGRFFLSMTHYLARGVKP